jgi:hypothetical protein
MTTWVVMRLPRKNCETFEEKKKRLMVQFKIQLGKTCQCNILSALVWNLFLYISPKYNAIYE